MNTIMILFLISFGNVSQLFGVYTKFYFVFLQSSSKPCADLDVELVTGVVSEILCEI